MKKEPPQTDRFRNRRRTYDQGARDRNDDFNQTQSSIMTDHSQIAVISQLALDQLLDHKMITAN